MLRHWRRTGDRTRSGVSSLSSDNRLFGTSTNTRGEKSQFHPIAYTTTAEVLESYQGRTRLTHRGPLSSLRISNE